MSRLNGRIHETGPINTSVDFSAVPTQHCGQEAIQYLDSANDIRRENYETSCPVKSKSGNVSIHSGEHTPLPMDYKQRIHQTETHNPLNENQKTIDTYNARFGTNIVPPPVLPIRNNLRMPGELMSPAYDAGKQRSRLLENSYQYLKCSWRCTAIVFVILAVLLAILFGFVAVRGFLSPMPFEEDCVTASDGEVVADNEQSNGKSPNRGNNFPSDLGSRRHPIDVGSEDARAAPLLAKRMRRSVSHDLDSSMASTVTSSTFNAPLLSSARSPNPHLFANLFLTAHKVEGPVWLNVSVERKSIDGTEDGQLRSAKHSFNFVNSSKIALSKNKSSTLDALPGSNSEAALFPSMDIVEYVSDYDLPPKSLNDEYAEEDDIDDGTIIFQNDYDYDTINQTDDILYSDIVSSSSSLNNPDSLITIEEPNEDDIGLANSTDVSKGTNSSLPHQGVRRRALINLLSINSNRTSGLKLPFTAGWDYNMGYSHRDSMIADDPTVRIGRKSSEQGNNMWNLGWIFNENKSLSKLGKSKGTGSNKSSKISTQDKQITNNYMQKSPASKPIRTFSVKNMKKTNYKPFSTWPTSKKGGNHVEPKKSMDARYKYSKGGRISNTVKSEPKGFFKRSTRNMGLPFDGSINRKTSFQSLNTAKRTYDPTNINGGPIPRSDPQQLPSKLLSLAGVSQREISPNPRKSGYPQHQALAIDVFPHLFEYDLDDHDDYYYDDDKAWFDKFWTDDDKLEDAFDKDKNSISKVIEKVESKKETAALHTTPSVNSLPLKLPKELKVMSLTKENFQVEAPNKPIIVEINEKTSKHMENKMLSEKATQFDIKSDPVRKRKKLFSYDKIEIVPLKEDDSKKKSPSSNLSNKSANEVYVHAARENREINANNSTTITTERTSSYTVSTVALPVTSKKLFTNGSSSDRIIYKPIELISLENHSNFSKLKTFSNDKSQPDRLAVYEESNRRTPITIQAYPNTYVNYSKENNISNLSNENRTIAKGVRTNDTATVTTILPPLKLDSKIIFDENKQEENKRTDHIFKDDISHNVISQKENITKNTANFSATLPHHVNIINNSTATRKLTVNVTISTDEANHFSKQFVKTPIYILTISIPTTTNITNPSIVVTHQNSAPTTQDQNSNGSEISEETVKTTNQAPTGTSTGPKNDSEITSLYKCPPCKCSSVPDSKPLINNASSVESSNNSVVCNSVKQSEDAGATTADPIPQSTTEKRVSVAAPTLSPHVISEIEDYKQRPQKTIPPDGTTFKMIEIGQQLNEMITPFGYWNMQFYQPQSAYVQFEVSIPRGASIGIYGRRNALPTHTSYDFLKVLSAYKVHSRRSIRSVTAHSQVETIVEYLEQGHWFMSIYNDDGDTQQLTLSAIVSSEFTKGCPKGCSGSGECVLGSCRCNPGFTGRDCTQMNCPILCSEHGEYSEGHCVCRPGWKGQECSVRHDECEIPDCTGHGHCVDGACRCAKGFKGKFCQEVDCLHPTCYDHGWCVNGSCVCSKGWRGPDCSLMDDAALQCLPDCSGNGHFDLVGQQCVCEPEWTGSQCNIKICGLDCGLRGRCEGGHCVCDEGWTGRRCEMRNCDARCEEHGQCKNGSCICMTGWNGRHCTIVGCPNSCSGHGACVMLDLDWSCKCDKNWEGLDCSSELERNCNDGMDNDNDGLIDCADAECCVSTWCAHSTLCKASVDPIDILLRKQPPAVTASFFQRMRFIVEESSVQVYAEMSSFNQSRASVVRGRIVSGRGSGLVGVRVSHFLPGNTGFTLSRHGGWFDLMVNGGGAVKLLFGKSQFVPITQTIWVPWNSIIVFDAIQMTTSEVIPPPPPAICRDHSYVALKPVVLATWKHEFQGGCPQCSAILAESQVIQESLGIPGTGLHLVYHSSRAIGYESTIQLQLTPNTIPPTLRRVYLRITIEGILFEKTFEADADIKYTYAWNRLNVYRQKVYGISWATVRIGFSYSNCDQIIYDTQSTQVSGHDVSVSDIGGWDLSIHHRYNFHEGILQKGDGTNLYLKQRPEIIRVLMGDGRQREVLCRNCNGNANSQRLLTPAALAAASDGSLFVADFNLIRRIYPNREVKTIVKLNETRVSYRYHLAISPVDGSVYISDPEGHQILKVKDTDDASSPESNYMPYVGSGERCLPGDEIGCGDGGLARDAKLQYPKGMVVSSKEVLFFADGTNVRAVDKDEIISTVIGTHMHRAHWQPLPCSGTISVADVSLRWPTTLAISPLDESLYTLDDHHVLKMTTDGQIKIIAGRPLHCPVDKLGPIDLAAHTTIRSPQSMAFDPKGNLYIVESDTERINRIRVITSDERIHNFAGTESKCNCREESCRCYDESHVLAVKAVFSTISAIAITPDATIHVLDQGNLRIRSIMASIPEPTSERNYEIYSPETQEKYIFNRFGHHIETRNIPTRRSLYTFIYTVNTSNGKLSSVTDASGNKISFLRDYAGHVSMIENSRHQKCHVKMTRMRKLAEMITPDEHNISLTYHGSSGLLRSRMDTTGRAHFFTYDTYGRLTKTVTPSGQVIDLSFDLSEEGARVTVTRNGESSVTMLIKDNYVTTFTGSASSLIAKLPDGSVILKNAWGHYTATDTVPYKLINDNVLTNSFPVPGRQRTEIADGLVNSFEWKYYYERPNHQSQITQVGRKMRVNGEDLLDFKYDIFSGTEAVVNREKITILNITYDDLGRPVRWSPVSHFEDVTLTYDRYGLIQEWSWGNQKENYIYDRSGRFQGIQYEDGSKFNYEYKDDISIKPYKLTVKGGTEHLLEYDKGGGLAAIVTPRGHKYKFLLQPSVLHNRFIFTYPGSHNHPYQILYTDDGSLLAKVLPQQTGRIVYSYDKGGRLQYQIFGDGSIEYGYQPETGLIRSVTLRELAYEQRVDNKYHAGLIKEQRIRFGPAVPMNAAKMKFLYDGNARPRKIEIEINGNQLPDYEMKYDTILGTLESVGDYAIKISDNNRTIIQDSSKNILKISDYNLGGRILEDSLTVRGKLTHRIKYAYDNKGRVASKTIWYQSGPPSVASNFTYSPDGFLNAVVGSDSWQFKYDRNGNMISVLKEDREITAVYDNADRLIGWGDQEINVYDAAGRVIRQQSTHFSYTARGNIRHAWKDNHFRTTYRHDHKGRLTSLEDDKGNVTQFLYVNLLSPNLPSHVHYPLSGITHCLYYDRRDHLIAISIDKEKLWIVTDNVGSPVAIYDSMGSMVKEIVRSPWGDVLKETNPDLKIQIDFFGGIKDAVTGLLFFGLYAYDPIHGQWMSPRFDKIPNVPEQISSIYMHRFENNNPVNNPAEFSSHYTDIHSWLRGFGIDMTKIVGSEYHDETIDNPLSKMEIKNIDMSMKVISGLSCSTESILKQFMRPSFLPDPLVQVGEPAFATHKSSMLGKFSSNGPVLGSGILVSRVNGRAMVTLVPSAENSVLQAVVTDVLNGSALLDITLPHHRHHTVYLIKEQSSSKQDDLEQLQRLSGIFNVTVHEGDFSEIRVAGARTSLLFIYGVSVDIARHHILRHVHHRSAEHAWKTEQNLLQTGGPSLHPWSTEEKTILLREGKVPGFTAAELHSVHKFPLLADDASNVVFRRDVDRRRRSKLLPTS